MIRKVICTIKKWFTVCIYISVLAYATILLYTMHIVSYEASNNNSISKLNSLWSSRGNNSYNTEKQLHVSHHDNEQILHPYYEHNPLLQSSRIITNKWSRLGQKRNLRRKLIIYCQRHCNHQYVSSTEQSTSLTNATVMTPFKKPFFCSESDSINTIPHNDNVRYDFSELPWDPSTVGILSKDKIVHGIGTDGAGQPKGMDSRHGEHISGAGPFSSLGELPTAEIPLHLHVIFVAIGSRFTGPGGQSYVKHAIRQWRRFHPPSISTIHLILDKVVATENADVISLAEEMSSHEHNSNSEGVKRSNSFQIHYEQDLMSPKWKEYLKVFYSQGVMHPGGSRKTGNLDFNKHVSGRFFAVEELMRRDKLTHVIHMESDIMIYDNLLPIVQSIARCRHEMASTVADHKGVIPSILYVRNSSSIGLFTTYLNSFLSCGKPLGEAVKHGYANDMTYLLNFYELYGSRYLALLPTWEHAKGELCVTEDLRRQATIRANARQVKPHSDNTLLSPIAYSADYNHISGDSPEYIVPPVTIRNYSVLFDCASFGQWYSSIASNTSSGVRGAARKEAEESKPPLHISNAVKTRYLRMYPPPLMVWEKYCDSEIIISMQQERRKNVQDKIVIMCSLMVPAWKGYRLLSLHVHSKNLHLFDSTDERLL